MPRRKTQHSLCCYRGSYRRTIGKHINSAGKLAPKKFLLGRDKRQAEAANGKLEMLWAIVEEHHRYRQESVSYPRPANDYTPAIWHGEELELAEAIRQGKHVVEVDDGGSDPAAYATRLHYLNETYGHILQFMPAAPEKLTEGQTAHRSASAHRLRQATLNAAIAKQPIPTAPGTATLYEAIDAFADHAERQGSSPIMQRKGRDDAKRIKHATADMPLEHFRYDAIQAIGDYWRGRPMTKHKTPKVMSIGGVENQLKAAKRFVRWLDRSDGFAWERPKDYEMALRMNAKKLRTADERAALAQGPAIWTDADLIAMYRHATDRERALMLIGLNFGFAQDETGTLRFDEIDTTGAAPILRRIRQKSEVYGEAEIWPETMKAIEWLDTEHKRRGIDDDGFVVHTLNGNRATRQRLTNAFVKLRDRTAAAEPDYTPLPYKTFRKTGGQLVREASDGETAGVFLCHGQPVASDDLLDVYTRRNFAKVHSANRAVRERLAPMFSTSPNAFERPRTRRNASALA